MVATAHEFCVFVLRYKERGHFGLSVLAALNKHSSHPLPTLVTIPIGGNLTNIYKENSYIDGACRAVWVRP